MIHRYLSPMVNQGTDFAPDYIPLATTVIPGSWGSDDVPDDETRRIVHADVDDATHTAILALDGVSEVAS